MKQRVLYVVCICALLILPGTGAPRGIVRSSPLNETQGSQQKPGPSQLQATSSPSGLKVYLEKHKDLPKTNLLRTGNIEKKPVGTTPLILDLEPGYYTVAVERSFNHDDADIPKAPRGCINNFSFGGSTVFWDCFKCNYYPVTDKDFRDEIDPYKRDGNIGVCFYAAKNPTSPIRYYRLYAIEKAGEAVQLEAKFEKAGNN